MSGGMETESWTDTHLHFSVNMTFLAAIPIAKHWYVLLLSTLNLGEQSTESSVFHHNEWLVNKSYEFHDFSRDRLRLLTPTLLYTVVFVWCLANPVPI